MNAEPTWVRRLAHLSHKESHTSIWDQDHSSGVSKECVLQQKRQSSDGSAWGGSPAKWVSFPFLVILCLSTAPTVPSSRGGPTVFSGEGQAHQDSRGASSWPTPPQSGARTSQSPPAGPCPRRGHGGHGGRGTSGRAGEQCPPTIAPRHGVLHTLFMSAGRDSLFPSGNPRAWVPPTEALPRSVLVLRERSALSCSASFQTGTCSFCGGGGLLFVLKDRCTQLLQKHK